MARSQVAVQPGWIGSGAVPESGAHLQLASRRPRWPFAVIMPGRTDGGWRSGRFNNGRYLIRALSAAASRVVSGALARDGARQWTAVGGKWEVTVDVEETEGMWILPLEGGPNQRTVQGMTM